MKKFLLISLLVTVGLIFSISTVCAEEGDSGVNQELSDTTVNAPIGSAWSISQIITRLLGITLQPVPVRRFSMWNLSSTQQMQLQGSPVSLPWKYYAGGWDWNNTSQLREQVTTSRIGGTYYYSLGRANLGISIGGGTIKPQFQQADTSWLDSYISQSEQGSFYPPCWGLGDSSSGFFWGAEFDYLCYPPGGIGVSAGYFSQENTNVGYYRRRRQNTVLNRTRTWEISHDKAVTTQFFARLFIQSLIGAFRPFFSAGINSTQIRYSGTASYLRINSSTGEVLSENETPFSYTMGSANILEFRSGADYDFNQNMLAWLELIWQGGHMGAKTGIGLRL